jgi:hypothetical protein
MRDMLARTPRLALRSTRCASSPCSRQRPFEPQPLLSLPTTPQSRRDILESAAAHRPCVHAPLLQLAQDAAALSRFLVDPEVDANGVPIDVARDALLLARGR